MLRKLKFYFIGLIPGLLIVFFILNQKGARCTGYLPNSRVIAETLSKKFQYSEKFKNQMRGFGVSEEFLKDSIITNGEIDFDNSHPQAKPCPDYYLVYPEKKPKYKVIFKKCKDTAYFESLEKFLYNIKA